MECLKSAPGHSLAKPLKLLNWIYAWPIIRSATPFKSYAKKKPPFKSET
jgi:hypothetical protein